MISILESIKQDYLKSTDEIIRFIDLINLCKSQDLSFAHNSKFYNKIKTSMDSIKEHLSATINAQYNAIIISLYGSFERAIKQATNTFIKYCIQNSFCLASKFSSDYISSAFKTVDRRHLKENKAIIQDLHLFFNENDITKFRSDISLQNYQNLRIDVIRSIANSIELPDPFDKVKKTDDFLCYIQARQALSSKDQARLYVDRINIDNAFQYIDNIVASRNQIAHEGRTDNRYDDTTLKEFVIKEFTIFVCQYIELLKHSWYIHCVKSNKMIEELNILNVFNNQIICFNTGENIINKKSIIIIKKGTDKYEVASIESIQHNKIDIDCSTVNQNIGCALTKTCKITFKYYLYLQQ